MTQSRYTTKATWLGTEYGCRVFKDGKPLVEGRCATRDLIGPTFRDLMRTLDKLGYCDEFTTAARFRKWNGDNVSINVKTIWF